jgi:hypothetical protein
MKSSLDDGSSDAWSIIERFAMNTNVKGVFMRNLENHKHYTLDLPKRKVMLSLLWMLTYRSGRDSGLYSMITTKTMTWYQAGKRNDMTSVAKNIPSKLFNCQKNIWSTKMI